MAIDTEFLKEKRAGLPMWSWAIIAAVALIAVFYFIRGRSSMNKANNSTGTVATDPYAAFTAAAMQTTTAPTGTGISDQSMETNTSWLSKMVNYLLNKGVDPLTAQTAGQTYLDGGVPLTTDQASLVSQAITQFGLPPEGVYGIPSVLAPTPPPSNTPPPTSTATVVGYIQSLGNPHGEEISQLMSDGSTHPVTAETYARLGKPPATVEPYAIYAAHPRGTDI